MSQAKSTVNETTDFSDKQIKAWRAYERVRQSGAYNMFDPRARVATRLSEEDYVFCMRHFTALKKAAGDVYHGPG